MKLNKASKVVLTGVTFALLGPLLANVRVLPPLAGFGLFLAGTFLAFGGAVAEAMGFLKKRPVSYPALIGFVPMLVVVLLFSKARLYPRVNDVSTDLDQIPQFVDAGRLPENAGRDMSYPDEYKPLVRRHYGDLTAAVVPGTPDEVMNRAIGVLKQRPFYTITREDRQAKELEAVAESSSFRFRDDFILRFRPVRGATHVDMRSKSRDGKGDAGANAQRIRMVLSAILKGNWD